MKNILAPLALAGTLAVSNGVYAQELPQVAEKPVATTNVMSRNVADDFARDDYFLHNQTLVTHKFGDNNLNCASISFERAPIGERYGIDFRNNDFRVDVGARDNNTLEGESHGLIQANTSFGYVGAAYEDMLGGKKETFIGRLNLENKVSFNGAVDTNQNTRIVGTYDAETSQFALMGGSSDTDRPIAGACWNNNAIWTYVRATPEIDARFEFGSIPHTRTSVAFGTIDTGLNELYVGSEAFWFNTGRFNSLSVPNISLGKGAGSVAGQVRYREVLGDRLIGQLYVRPLDSLYLGGEAWHRFQDSVSGGAIETGVDLGNVRLRGRVEHDSTNDWYGGIMFEVNF